MPKGCQKGAEIDATNHQKSMQKLVVKKRRKIIQKHVSQNGKIIELHCKNNVFLLFRRLHARTKKVINNHQK
jgi:hypothetical protein